MENLYNKIKIILDINKIAYVSNIKSNQIVLNLPNENLNFIIIDNLIMVNEIKTFYILNDDTIEKIINNLKRIKVFSNLLEDLSYYI